METKNQNIIYKDLTYKIIGICYDIFYELGHGHKELYYKNALALVLGKEKMKYQREIYAPLIYKNHKVGKYFFDFLVENKIVLEIKRGDRISQRDIKQLYGYLKSKNLKLGLIIRFTSKGVVAKRVVNLKSVN